MMYEIGSVLFSHVLVQGILTRAVHIADSAVVAKVRHQTVVLAPVLVFLGENVQLHHLDVGGLHVTHVTLQLGGVEAVQAEAALAVLGLPGVLQLYSLHLQETRGVRSFDLFRL